MTAIAITGFSGLVGGYVGCHLATLGHKVIGISRQPITQLHGQEIRSVPDLIDLAAMKAALNGCDMLIHCADRADRRAYREKDVKAAASVMSTIRTAAAECGLTRIVVASSIHAEREGAAVDRYARSKRALEIVALAGAPGVPAAVLRLPPLHGKGARGSVRHVARAAKAGWPLPFALATAPRRFLSLEALSKLCATMVALDQRRFRALTGRIWYPSSARESSLASLAVSIGGARARLVPIPGIDWLLGNHLSAVQLADEQGSLFKVTGWRAD